MAESTAKTNASPPAPSTHKSGIQLLHELLAIVYHVVEEAKHVNLKPPLQPSSRMFSLDAITTMCGTHSPPRSPVPPDSPTEEPPMTTIDLNGTTPNHTVTPSQGHQHNQPVIPYSSEEIQDSFTKIAMLKTQYIKISMELMEMMKQVEQRRQNPVLAKEMDEKEQETVEKLKERRSHLQREVYERNLVMKGLIDRLRHLQYSIRMIKGGNTNTTPIVMESV